MSFGLSAAAVGALSAAAAVGTAVYTANAQRKLMHQQQDAVTEAQKADALKAADAEKSAGLAANQQQAEINRRRRASSLSAGAPDTLGSSSVLGAGSPSVAVTAKPSTSALGKAAGY